MLWIPMKSLHDHWLPLSFGGLPPTRLLPPKLVLQIRTPTCRSVQEREGHKVTYISVLVTNCSKISPTAYKLKLTACVLFCKAGDEAKQQQR